MQGHGLAVGLPTVSRENDPKLRGVALGANEGMVLEAGKGIRDDFHQDQLSTTRRTTHRSDSDQRSLAEHPTPPGRL
jgi:hypothetical protein